ncbi:MAG: hypothetical protein ACYC5S_04505 [Thiobacillus sp.]
MLEFAAWIRKKGDEDEKNLLQLTQTITLLEGREEEKPDAVRLSTLRAGEGPRIRPRLPGRRRGEHSSPPRRG